MKFNWQHYLSEQLQWAESLISRAEECEGVERHELHVLAQSTLRDASRLVGQMSAGQTSHH
jgi:hypothetical protein|tara:strand:+ start:4731 stop:4913 length:183 start_codon:yes stop_codon:yes gene_type:complete